MQAGIPLRSAEHRPQAASRTSRCDITRTERLNLMLHAIALFGTLCIVETVERTHQVTGNTTNALKTGRRLEIVQLNVVAVNMRLYAAYFGVLLFCTHHICGGFLCADIRFALKYYAINFFTHFYLQSQYIVF